MEGKPLKFRKQPHRTHVGEKHTTEAWFCRVRHCSQRSAGSSGVTQNLSKWGQDPGHTSSPFRGRDGRSPLIGRLCGSEDTPTCTHTHARTHMHTLYKIANEASEAQMGRLAWPPGGSAHGGVCQLTALAPRASVSTPPCWGDTATEAPLQAGDLCSDSPGYCAHSGVSNCSPQEELQKPEPKHVHDGQVTSQPDGAPPAANETLMERTGKKPCV